MSKPERTERDELMSACIHLAQFAQHKQECFVYRAASTPGACTCGVEEARERYKAAFKALRHDAEEAAALVG